MIGSDAVKRVNDAIGFRKTGHSLESTIALRFAEAQDDLEMGKTLPKFLLQEDQSLILALGAHTSNLPTSFARADDERPISYVITGQSRPTFLQQKRIYKDAIDAYSGSDFSTTGFKVYVIRNAVVDFIINAPAQTTFIWSYYKYADAFALDSANAWLSHKTGKWWLIGEAGYRMALDLRDMNAKALFDDMRQRARAATFGDILAREDESGPLVMGANL